MVLAEMRLYLEPELRRMESLQDQLVFMLQRHDGCVGLEIERLVGWAETDKLELSRVLANASIPSKDAQKIYHTLSIMITLKNDIVRPFQEFEKFLEHPCIWKKHTLQFFWNGFVRLEGREFSFKMFQQLVARILDMLSQPAWKKTREYITLHSNDMSHAPTKFLADVMVRQHGQGTKQQYTGKHDKFLDALRIEILHHPKQS
jgi:hypothetical protein